MSINDFFDRLSVAEAREILCRLQEGEISVSVPECNKDIVREKLTEKNNQLSLTDICSSAGLGPGDERDGSPEYYFSEKIVSDDPKGIGALMMVYAHYIKCCGKMQEED